MKVFRLIVQALAGILLAAAAALAVSTWGLAGENDELFSAAGLRLGVCGAGAGLAVLVMLAFADGWIGERKRRGGDSFPGTLLNGLGFGLLPGAVVWKIFEQLSFLSGGAAVQEGIPAWPWLTENGFCAPCRIEISLGIAAFTAVILWLILRKEELPENGDLLPVSLMLWGTIRLISEAFRASEAALPGVPGLPVYAAAGIMLVILLSWTRRAFRNQKNTGYAFACIPVFLAASAVIVLQQTGLLTVNPAADTAIRGACALLAMKAVVCMGRVTRK